MIQIALFKVKKIIIMIIIVVIKAAVICFVKCNNMTLGFLVFGARNPVVMLLGTSELCSMSADNQQQVRDHCISKARTRNHCVQGFSIMSR